MRNFLILCAVLAGLVTWTTIAGSKPNAKVTLTFIWHAGDRANLFQKIARQYTTETGVEQAKPQDQRGRLRSISVKALRGISREFGQHLCAAD